MKLSIITPVFKESKRLDKFLLKISSQKSKDFELILIVDSNADNTLETIDKHRRDIKGNLRIIFNSKRNSRFKSICQGAKIAKGKYSLILSTRNEFTPSLVGDVIQIYESKKTDIIEFNATFSSPIKFQGKIRKQFRTSADIKSTPEIIARTYPFDFNKIFKTKILAEVSKTNIPVNFNSRYSIDITYLSLNIAKTYSTSSRTLVKSRVNSSSEFNFIQFTKHFDSIVDLIIKSSNPESIDKYLYAQYFTEVIFVSPLVKSSRNRVLIKKFNERFKKRSETKYANLLDINHYLVSMPKEKSVLLSHTAISSMHKAYKELEK